jgi:hypothetical protein
VITKEALIVMFNALVALLELASVTFAVKLLVPVAVGVPVIAPVLALSDSPVGRLPALMDQVSGEVPPVAVSVTL